ncbi:hypothetical protein AB0926_32355 [Streptomyces griseoincarnatus]|uniref:hypothetical protein n=1 Tax=Streptomyces sp. NPDC013172 TaxID=3155009 RepID=UPI0033C0B4D3
MPSKSAGATVRSRYMEQAAADLEENLRQQQELARQIDALREEETLLKSILDLAGHSEAMPEQAQEESTPRPSRAPSRGAPPSAERGRRRETAAPQQRGRKARQSAATLRPLLQDLLLELLKGHAEPCPAHELREELLRAHPDRTPTPQVVRNTLEGLVAKGLIERHKQNRSVLYTVVR